MGKTIGVQDLRHVNLTCNETWPSHLKYLVTRSVKRAHLYPACRTFCLWPWLVQFAVHQNKDTTRPLHLSFLSVWKPHLCPDEREAPAKYESRDDVTWHLGLASLLLQAYHFPPPQVAAGTWYGSSAPWPERLIPTAASLLFSGIFGDESHTGVLKCRSSEGLVAPWWLGSGQKILRNMPQCASVQQMGAVIYLLVTFPDGASVFALITPLCSFSYISPRCSYLAAIPPWRRFETLGLPSLSIPPDTVSPRVVPSFFISSTTVEPLNSSAKRKAFALLNESRSTRWRCAWWRDSFPETLSTFSFTRKDQWALLHRNLQSIS